MTTATIALAQLGEIVRARASVEPGVEADRQTQIAIEVRVRPDRVGDLRGQVIRNEVAQDPRVLAEQIVLEHAAVDPRESADQVDVDLLTLEPRLDDRADPVLLGKLGERRHEQRLDEARDRGRVIGGLDPSGETQGRLIVEDRDLGAGERGRVDDLGPVDQLGVDRGVKAEVLGEDVREIPGATRSLGVVKTLARAVDLEVFAVAGQLKRRAMVIEVPGQGRVLGIAKVDDRDLVGAREVRFIKRIAAAVVLGDVNVLDIIAMTHAHERAEQRGGGGPVETTAVVEHVDAHGRARVGGRSRRVQDSESRRSRSARPPKRAPGRADASPIFSLRDRPLLACSPMAQRPSPKPLRTTRAVLGLALGLALSLSVGCASADKRSPEQIRDSANNHYEIALGSAQAGSMDDAKKQLELALQAVPEHGNSHYLLGLIKLNEGRAIIEFIESEMCLTDAAADAQRGRADVLHREAHKSFSRAAAAYDANDPSLGRAYNSMSVVSLYFHDYDRAHAELEQALDAQFYTEKYSALANLGWAYYERGDLVAAMTELRQSVLMNPDYCVGRYRLAQVYLDYQMTEEALEEIERVIADERCPIQDAHRIAGVARMRLGFGVGAAEAFEGCLALAPRSCLANACRQFLALAASDARPVVN